jgi:hypothetical protein
MIQDTCTYNAASPKFEIFCTVRPTPRTRKYIKGVKQGTRGGSGVTHQMFNKKKDIARTLRQKQQELQRVVCQFAML